MIDRKDIEAINSSDLLGGYKLNPDSWIPLESKGVRVLKVGTAKSNSNGNFGQLIVGTKKTLNDPTFLPVYSIRDFAIWWHKASSKSDANALLKSETSRRY